MKTLRTKAQIRSVASSSPGLATGALERDQRRKTLETLIWVGIYDRCALIAETFSILNYWAKAKCSFAAASAKVFRPLGLKTTITALKVFVSALSDLPTKSPKNAAFLNYSKYSTFMYSWRITNFFFLFSNFQNNAGDNVLQISFNFLQIMYISDIFFVFRRIILYIKQIIIFFFTFTRVCNKITIT